jgi:hypothetical protein
MRRDGRMDIIAPAVGEGVLPAGADANRQTTWVLKAAITAACSRRLTAARVERLRVRAACASCAARAASDAVIDAAIDLIAA